MANWQRWKGIMKCYPFEEKRLAKWEPPFIVQPKYDGVRCRAIPIGKEEYMMVSSEENIIYSVPHIDRAFNTSSLPRWEYDGELYCHGMSFEEIVSITSRTVNLHYQHNMIQFHMFDIVNDAPQHSRIVSLTGLKNDLRSNHSIMLAPFYICDTLEEIMRVYDTILESGYEGIIVRHYQAPYERKRSLYVMKFKPKKEDCYEILDYTQEVSNEGTPKGRLGALMCRSGDGNTFSVGTGFSDQQREDLWLRKETLGGATCRVQYQHLTAGKKVPRFPVFVEVIDG